MRIALQQVRSFVARGMKAPDALFHVAQKSRVDYHDLKRLYETDS